MPAFVPWIGSCIGSLICTSGGLTASESRAKVPDSATRPQKRCGPSSDLHRPPCSSPERSCGGIACCARGGKRADQARDSVRRLVAVLLMRGVLRLLKQAMKMSAAQHARGRRAGKGWYPERRLARGSGLPAAIIEPEG